MSNFRPAGKKSNNPISTINDPSFVSPANQIKRATKIKLLPTAPKYGSLGNPMVWNPGSSYSINATIEASLPTLPEGQQAQFSPIFGITEESINIVNPGVNHIPGDVFNITCDDIGEKSSLPARIVVSQVDSNGSITKFFVDYAGYRFNNNNVVIEHEVTIDIVTGEDEIRESLVPAIIQFVPNKFKIIDLDIDNAGSGYQMRSSDNKHAVLHNITASDSSGSGFFGIAKVGPIIVEIDYTETEDEQIVPTTLADRRINFNSKDKSFSSSLSEDEDIVEYNYEVIEPTIVTPYNSQSQTYQYRFDALNNKWNYEILQVDISNSNNSDSSSGSEGCTDITETTTSGSITTTATLSGSTTVILTGTKLSKKNGIRTKEVFKEWYRVMSQIRQINLDIRAELAVWEKSGLRDPLFSEAANKANEIRRLKQLREQRIQAAIAELHKQGKIPNITKYSPNSDQIEKFKKTVLDRAITRRKIVHTGGTIIVERGKDATQAITDFTTNTAYWRQRIRDVIDNIVETSDEVQDLPKIDIGRKGPKPTNSCPVDKNGFPVIDTSKPRTRPKKTPGGLAAKIAAALAAAAAGAWYFFGKTSEGSEFESSDQTDISEETTVTNTILDLGSILLPGSLTLDIALDNKIMGDGTFETEYRDTQQAVEAYLFGQISEENFRELLSNKTNSGILDGILEAIDPEIDTSNIDNIIESLNSVSETIAIEIEERKLEILIEKYHSESCVEIDILTTIEDPSFDITEYCEEFKKTYCPTEDNSANSDTDEVPVSVDTPVDVIEEFYDNLDIPTKFSVSRCY